MRSSSKLLTRVLLILTFLLFSNASYTSALQENGIEVKLFDHDANWSMPGSISMAELCNIKVGAKILTLSINGKLLKVQKMVLNLDIRSTKQSFMDPQSTEVLNEQDLGEMKKMQPGDEIICSNIVYMTPDHKEVKTDTKYRIRVRN